jgi:hypothetical protein
LPLPPACACAVPDTDFDIASLWQRVMVSKAKAAASDIDKLSNRGTYGYDKVLYRLGIDVDHVAKATLRRRRFSMSESTSSTKVWRSRICRAKSRQPTWPCS